MRQHNADVTNCVKKNKQSDSHAKHFGDLWNEIDKIPSAGPQRGMANCKVAWQGNPITAAKSFGKSNCVVSGTVARHLRIELACKREKSFTAVGIAGMIELVKCLLCCVFSVMVPNLREQSLVFEFVTAFELCLVVHGRFSVFAFAPSTAT